MRIKLVYLLMFGILCILNAPTFAAIVGPYGQTALSPTVDANTMHLWHLDEGTVNAVDQAHYAYTGTYTTLPDANLPLTYLGGASPNNAGTTGTVYASATLGNASYTGFGTALDTSAVSGVPPYPTNSFQPVLNAKIPANGAADNVDHTFDNPTTHAFTMEAVIQIKFNPMVSWAQPQEIIAGEGDAGDSTDRSWQFRIEANANPSTTTWKLRFQKVSGFGGAGGSTSNWDITRDIPTAGDDAIMMDGWYHVAVTYNGSLADATPDSTTLYWTKMDPANTAAHQLGLAADMNGWLREQDCDFSIGNEMRDFNGETEPFNGRIDEVRISDTARAADQMMFVPEPSTIVMALIGAFGMGLIWLRKRS
jgi:hypothetical protein